MDGCSDWATEMGETSNTAALHWIFRLEKSQLPLGEKPDYGKKDQRTAIIWDSFCHSLWCLIHRHNVPFGIGAAIVTALKKCFSWFAYVSSTRSGKQWKWVKAPALEDWKENSFPQLYSKNINRAHFFFLHNVFLTFTSLLCVHLCVYQAALQSVISNWSLSSTAVCPGLSNQEDHPCWKEEACSRGALLILHTFYILLPTSSYLLFLLHHSITPDPFSWSLQPLMRSLIIFSHATVKARGS